MLLWVGRCCARLLHFTGAGALSTASWRRSRRAIPNRRRRRTQCCSSLYNQLRSRQPIRRSRGIAISAEQYQTCTFVPHSRCRNTWRRRTALPPKSGRCSISRRGMDRCFGRGVLGPPFWPPEQAPLGHLWHRRVPAGLPDVFLPTTPAAGVMTQSLTPNLVRGIAM